MALEDLGNLGEFVAAIATLVTLAYLALQIRQSNRIATWEAHRSSIVAFNHASGLFVGDGEMARIFRVGLFDVEQLDADERIRLFHALAQLILNFKDVLEARDAGLYDDETYEAWEGYLCAILNMPGGSVWWEENAQNYVARVRDAIDAGRPKQPRYADPTPTFWIPPEPRG